MLNGPKFTVSALESLAKFLDIELVDSDHKKLFTKPTLARRLTSAVFALLPSMCDECSVCYAVPKEPTSDCKPLLNCFVCYQGSHWCEAMSSMVSALSDMTLPRGMIWLCDKCTDMSTSMRKGGDKKGGDRSRCNSVSSISTRSRANSLTEELSEDSTRDLDKTTPESSEKTPAKSESSEKAPAKDESSEKAPAKGESSEKAVANGE